MSEMQESFSPSEQQKLLKYVTNVDGSVFALRNLPEVVKGALFSKYSRSTRSLRSLLLHEFLSEESELFSVNSSKSDSEDFENQEIEIQKAKNFYDRILDNYGDDSIGELGAAHLAFENISMIAAKAIENPRIGGSPLEKSTRYVYFDQKVNGKFQYHRESVIMTSAFRGLYVDVCDFLFETYSSLLPPLTHLLEKKHPKGEGLSSSAYTSSIRAKVLDEVRGLLPASTYTNVGILGNGRFFETLLQKLAASSLEELRQLSGVGFSELSKVIPSFVRRGDIKHRHGGESIRFHEKLRRELKEFALSLNLGVNTQSEAIPHVKLVEWDVDAPYKVAAALLFEYSQESLEALEARCKQMPHEELARLFNAVSCHRNNRRDKAPRALEHCSFLFQFESDFGVYRDLQRHRMMTQDRQLLGCDLDYYSPGTIAGTAMESPYHTAMMKAKEAHATIAREFPEEAQYLVPLGYQVRWYARMNLRAAQWLCELRSGANGHTSYRLIAQMIAKQIIEVEPLFESFFGFVDYEGYELGRLGQEVRALAKQGGEPL